MPRSKSWSQVLWVIVALALVSCQQSTPRSRGSIEFQQYYAKGAQLYSLHCENCHQKNGTGLGRLYPPLHQSDYLQQNPEQLACLIRYGISGSIQVNGQEYNMAMKPNPLLDDLEIAEITTYVLNTWSHEYGLFRVDRVSRLLDSCRMANKP